MHLPSRETEFDEETTRRRERFARLLINGL
jgi:hypothetical protein